MGTWRPSGKGSRIYEHDGLDFIVVFELVLYRGTSSRILS